MLIRSNIKYQISNGKMQIRNAYFLKNDFEKESLAFTHVFFHMYIRMAMFVSVSNIQLRRYILLMFRPFSRCLIFFGTCLSPSCFAKALIERINSWKMRPSSNNKTENWLTTRILQRNFAGKEPSATASSFYHKITK